MDNEQGLRRVRVRMKQKMVQKQSPCSHYFVEFYDAAVTVAAAASNK